MMSEPRSSTVKNIQTVILAGGLASRLRPVTEKIPKALIDICGTPFIRHQLELLKRNGLRKFLILVGYHGDMIEKVLGDGSSSGLEIQYQYDGEKLKGTGGALRNTLRHLEDEFLLLYGDSYLDVDYEKIINVYKESGAAALMAVYKNQNRGDVSNVLFRDGKLLAYNKAHPSSDMDYIDYGIALLRREVIERIPAGEVYDLHLLYTQLVLSGEMIGYEVFRRFYEVGSPSGLEEFRKKVAAGLT